MQNDRKRLLVIWYSADYRQVYRRFIAGEPETYHGHNYCLEALLDLSQQMEEVGMLCCKSSEAYNEQVAPGFRVIATGFDPYAKTSALLKLIADFKPTHLVLCAPIKPILQWANQHQVKTIALLADSFLNNHWRKRIRHFSLTQQLNHPNVEWVGNHGINACKSLSDIGVQAQKVIPWDWPHPISPREYNAKRLPSLQSIHKPWHLIYIGAVALEKGVGDAIEAIAILRRWHPHVVLTIVGQGDIAYFQRLAHQLGISANVNFLGKIANQDVLKLMRQADAVLVPSWHEYPEGFPLTIYESLCVRTPIVASDHPMFRGILQNRQSAMIFPAKQPLAFSQQIEALMQDSHLYADLSMHAYSTWQQLQLPVHWAELIQRWLRPCPENQSWLSTYCLTSDHYDLVNSRVRPYSHRLPEPRALLQPHLV
jgi:glycosyltransferase involved in cell wall biosynthesis